MEGVATNPSKGFLPQGPTAPPPSTVAEGVTVAVREPRTRTPVTGEALLRVQYRITDRDLTLLGWLADHGVLTTDQIAHALFPSLDFAQRRLLKLTKAGLIDRFRPQRPDGGSHPYHYVLSQLGVEVMAAQRDEDDLPRKDRARKRRWWLTNRANLPHLLAVNQFFTDLAGHARTHPDNALERWWPSSRCQQPGAFTRLNGDVDVHAWSATVAADGHGIWTDTTPDDVDVDLYAADDGLDGDDLDGQDGASGVRVPFFVEVDLSTEDLPRLAAKVGAYQRWSRLTGHIWPVLFWLGPALRERHLHTRLAEHSTWVPVATATRDHTQAEATSPAGPVWWLHGLPSGERLTLADLATTVTRTHT